MFPGPHPGSNRVSSFGSTGLILLVYLLVSDPSPTSYTSDLSYLRDVQGVLCEPTRLTVQTAGVTRHYLSGTTQTEVPYRVTVRPRVTHRQPIHSLFVDTVVTTVTRTPGPKYDYTITLPRSSPLSHLRSKKVETVLSPTGVNTRPPRLEWSSTEDQE